MKNKDNRNNENIAKNTDIKNSREAETDLWALSSEQLISMLKAERSSAEELEKNFSELQTKLAEAEKTAADNKDSWYRCAAEFENFKRRNAETRQTAYFDGKKDAITSLLIIGDSVDRALSVELDEKTRAGVMLIKKQFDETLTALNVEVIDPKGEKFDPSHSEAIATVPKNEGEESDLVRTVYKKGYKLSGKILRYAQVVVTQ